MHHASCTFLCRRCSTTTWNCLILRFVEGVKATQWFSTEKNCGYSLLEVNSSKIHHYFMNWVTWNKHGTMNFETTWIHFLRDVFPTVVFVFLKLPVSTVKPVYNEAEGTGKICLLLRARCRYIEGISPIFYHYWGEQYRSLYLGLCHLGFVICRVVDSLLCWYDPGIACMSSFTAG